MHRLVPALETARLHRGRKAKVAALAEALVRVAADGDDEDLATAVRVVAGQALPLADGRATGVGFALLMAAASAAYGLVATDVRTRSRALGDMGDAVGELAVTAGSASDRPGLSLSEVAHLTTALAATTDRTAKESMLAEAFARARPDQAKYLTKLLLGELRIGVREGVLEEAIAAAFARAPEEVHAAAALCSDPGDLAVLARHDELGSATLVVGRPVAFMLASPVETVKAEVDLARTAWEDKLDGIRVQAHVKAGVVRLFARGGGDVSLAFPEVVAALARASRDVILDGELLAIAVGEGDGEPPRARPFQALQARLGRKDPSPDLLAQTPVALFAFDMLFDGEPIVSLSWETRRARMEAFFREAPLAPVVQPTTTHRLDVGAPLDEQLDAAYRGARARGHEGIVIKDADSPYETGRRGSAWRKVKRALATLDVVVTRAERGHGKRAGVLSDYTFAVWDETNGALVDIGKAYSGLTDLEIAELTRVFEASAIEKERGGAVRVEPEVVLEVAFDGLQKSKRHTSGFALRFPRIARIRADKTPRDIDTLATVRALWDAQLSSGHREEVPQHTTVQPKLQAKKRRDQPPAGDAQLSLFGDGPRAAPSQGRSKGRGAGRPTR
jgi:DNA ligase 1